MGGPTNFWQARSGVAHRPNVCCQRRLLLFPVVNGLRPDMTSVRTVGFIGLGAMGGAIATRIIEASSRDPLWARRPEALKPFGRKNVTTVPTPRGLATRVDLVGVCVWSDDDVRQVLLGESGILDGCRPGTIIAIHSTIQPSTCRELAAASAGTRTILLDAPISGGRKMPRWFAHYRDWWR